MHLESVLRNLVDDWVGICRTDQCRTYRLMNDELLDILLRLLHYYPNSLTTTPHFLNLTSFSP
jgi:hypothetical protein